jgi:hypothetical protein
MVFGDFSCFMELADVFMLLEASVLGVSRALKDDTSGFFLSGVRMTISPPLFEI